MKTQQLYVIVWYTRWPFLFKYNLICLSIFSKSFKLVIRGYWPLGTYWFILSNNFINLSIIQYVFTIILYIFFLACYPIQILHHYPLWNIYYHIWWYNILSLVARNNSIRYLFCCYSGPLPDVSPPRQPSCFWPSTI